MAVVYARVAPKRDTTLNWSKHPEFVPFRGEIIIYMDYKVKTDDEGKKKCIPGLKVGDGRTPVNDLPFINEAGGGGGGVSATINGVPVEGDLTLEDLGIQPAGSYPSEEFSADDIDALIDAIDDE